MIPEINENEIIYHSDTFDNCGIALNHTQSFIEDEFFVIPMNGYEKDEIKTIHVKLRNTIFDIIIANADKGIVILTLPGFLRATMLIYYKGMSQQEIWALLNESLLFFIAYAKTKNLIATLDNFSDKHITCDAEIVATSEVYQEYFGVTNDDSMHLFGSNIITAATMCIDCDEVNPAVDGQAFIDVISQLRYTKIDCPLEVRYGNTGYGISVNLDKAKSLLTSDIEVIVSQLYNAMLTLLLPK